MSLEETRKIELWRAFFLGVRATLVSNDVALTNKAMKRSVDKLEAVANGEETIYDPEADARFFGKADEEFTHRVHIAFRTDRELAQEIAEGFELIQ